MRYRRNRQATHRLTFLAIIAAVSLAGCEFFEQAAATNRPIWVSDLGGNTPLQQPSGEVRLSAYQPANPYQRLAGDLLIRSVAQVSTRGAAFNIGDLLVGPNRQTEKAKLSSAAAFTVLTGEGVLQLFSSSGNPGERIDIRPGATGVIGIAEEFSIINTSNQHIDIRVRLIAAQ